MRPSRRRRRTLGAAAALILAAGLTSSCGKDSSTGLSQERAASLRSMLDGVEDRVASSDCAAAAQRAGSFRQEVGALPSRVDRDLRDALEQSATRLESLVADECKPAAPVEEAPVATPPTTDESAGGDQQGKGGKDKKPKKQKQPKTPKKDEQPLDTGGSGQEGSTGVTGQDGSTPLPESGE